MRFAALLVLMFCAISTASAQAFRVPSVDNSRAGKWEFTLQVPYFPSQGYNGEYGNTLDLKSRTGIGFDLGYNLTSHFALGFEMNYLAPRYTLTISGSDPEDPSIPVEQVVDNRADIVTGQFTGTWNILKTPFTPFVDLGAGWTSFDSNITSSVPVCWFDYWWGWVCSSSTYGDSAFSYSASAGVRWEIGHSGLLKLSANRMIIDTGGNPEFDTIRFEIGSRF